MPRLDAMTCGCGLAILNALLCFIVGPPSNNAAMTINFAIIAVGLMERFDRIEASVAAQSAKQIGESKAATSGDGPLLVCPCCNPLLN